MDKQCSVPFCSNRYYAKGYCRHHYYFVTRYGNPDTKQPIPKTCTYEGCTEPHHAKGLCEKHYYHDRYEKNVGYKPQRYCTIAGCGKEHYAKDYCRNHYNQWARFKAQIIEDLLEKIRRNVEKL